jgi:heterodisulfide reductase subunit A
VKKVRDAVDQFEGVKIAKTDEYVCSVAGQSAIKQAIADQGINWVVVASCSPHLRLETFRRAVSVTFTSQSVVLTPFVM